MSYSFRVRSASLLGALAAAAAAFDSIVLPQQPEHAKDRDAALANAKALGEVLDPSKAEGQHVQIDMHGSLGWRSEGDAKSVLSVNASASVYYVHPDSPGLAPLSP